MAIIDLFFIRRAKSQTFKAYWASRSPVEPGFKVPPYQNDSPLEQFFEKIRKEEFPHMPPRVGSIMLCPALEGFCEKGNFQRPYIYEVEAVGDYVILDSTNFTEEAVATSSSSITGFSTREFDPEFPRMYWSGQPAYHGRDSLMMGSGLEILLQGEATVIKEVDDWSEAEEWYGLKQQYRFSDEEYFHEMDEEEKKEYQRWSELANAYFPELKTN